MVDRLGMPEETQSGTSVHPMQSQGRSPLRSPKRRYPECLLGRVHNPCGHCISHSNLSLLQPISSTEGNAWSIVLSHPP